jgi:3-oxoacyl-[acyl-carrier-protein] synthase-3
MLDSLKNIRFYLPKNKISNAILASQFKLTEEEIIRKTGIENRYQSDENELSSDMATAVAENFFAEFPDKKNEVDFLIFCSECFDFIAPATSCILQNRIGLNQQIGCIDLPYGCSGYIYGLLLAKSLLKSGMANNILFITADTPSKTIPKDSLELQNIFSDAATVTYLNKENAEKIGEFVLGTDGSGKESLLAINSAFRKTEKTSSATLFNPEMKMDGIEIFNFGLRIVPNLVEETLAKNNLTKNDIDFYILHQPTKFLLQTLRKKMDIPEEKWIINIQDYGNTVSSSIPLVLSDLMRQNKLKKDMNLLLVGFGIGYSWGATLLKT